LLEYSAYKIDLNGCILVPLKFEPKVLQWKPSRLLTHVKLCKAANKRVYQKWQSSTAYSDII
jgi:hypothetical protein